MFIGSNKSNASLRPGRLALLAALLSACGCTSSVGRKGSSTAGARCANAPLPLGVVAFAEGMTPPNPSTLPPPPLTPEATAARSFGRVLVSCIITTEGEAKQCNLLETVPYMSMVVLDSIRAQRFEPAKVDGKPQAVEYTFGWEYLAGGYMPLEPPPAWTSFFLNPESPLPNRVMPLEPLTTNKSGALFGPSLKMTRPARISGPQLQYTREALCHGVEGIVIVNCIITEEGKVEGCVVRQTVPYMEETIVEHLQSGRYAPATMDGVPRRVRYTFNIRLMLAARR